MSEAALRRKDSTGKEDFICRCIEDGSLVGKPRRESRIDRYLPDKGIFPKHGEEFGMEYLEEGGSRVSRVE